MFACWQRLVFLHGTSNERMSVHYYLLMPVCQSGWKGYIRVKSVDPQFFFHKKPCKKRGLYQGCV